MKKFVTIIGAFVLFICSCYAFYVMVFPPKMIWQEFGRTPIADLGYAGKNIPLEKADTIFAYRVILRDVNGTFSPSAYIKKYNGDVAIGNLIFTQDKDRIIKFMSEKGVKLLVENAPYHPKAHRR